MRFVVLCSSKGSVLEAVIESIKKGDLTASCIGLVSDKEDHGCVAKAKAANIPVTIVPMKKDEIRRDYDRRVDTAIRVFTGDNTKDVFITCMGWMWMLSPWFVRQWKNRILNVHPALLPKHPGAHAHDLVIAAKDTESGMTIHLIDEGMDTGKILLQKSCPVLPDDTAATLKIRVQQLECEWYTKVLQMIATGEMKV